MDTRVLSSGKATHRLQVPYRLIESGPPGNKPLVIWLHGYGQTATWIMEHTELIWKQSPGFHLFVQAPYLLVDQFISAKKEGYSWYLFNGDKETYVASIEHAAEFVLDLVSKLRPLTGNPSIHLVGYSQGAYLAGYLALHRPRLMHRVCMIAGRFKHEWVTDWQAMAHIELLAIHGSRDTEVLPEPQQEAMRVAAENGIPARFQMVSGGHRWSSEMSDLLSTWMNT